MVARFFVFVATLLLGSLFIEVSIYHPSVAMARDAVAIAPGVAAAFAICGGFLLLAFGNRLAAVVFGVACVTAIIVGLLGTAIHLGIHASSIAALVTDPKTWMGNPPTLAPLSFTVGGCLGLVPLAWRLQIAPPYPTASRFLEVAASLAGLVATIAATQISAGNLALVAVICGIGLGSIGYAFEWARLALAHRIA